MSVCRHTLCVCVHSDIYLQPHCGAGDSAATPR